MKPRVLLLGASRYYVRSILAARDLGCETLVMDRNPDSPGLQVCDVAIPVDFGNVDAALAAVRDLKLDAVVPLNDFGVPTAAAVAERFGLAGISRDAARNATSKARMRQCWEAAGAPSVRFRVVRTLDEAVAAALDLGTWPLILKPADSRGGGSRGVSRVDRPEDIPTALSFAQQHYDDPAVVIEEFVDGLEHSVETLTWQGHTHVIAVSDKVKTPLPYRVDKSVNYPTRLTGEALERIRGACEWAVRSLGIDIGAAHVELATTASGPVLFELGARCGGGGTPDPIVPHVTGVNVLHEVIRLALGRPPIRMEPVSHRGCVYRFLTPSPGLLQSVAGLAEVRCWPGILDADVLVTPGETIRPVRSGGDRAGFVIAAGDTREEAEALADRAEHEIKFHVS